MAQDKRKDSFVKAAKEAKNKRKRKAKIFASPNKGKIWHMMGKTAGIITMLVGGLTFLGLFIRNSHHGMGLSYTNYFYGMVFVVGLIIFLLARSASKRLARFRYYRTFLEDKEFMCLNEIADITGRKISFLQKDLWKMIQKKLFLQGNMNEQGTCLFLTEEMYQRYVRGEVIPGVNTGTDEPQTEPASNESGNWGAETDNWSSSEKMDIDAMQEQSVEEGNPQTASFETVCDNHLHIMDNLIHQIRDKQMKASAADICVRGKQIMFYKETEMAEDVERFLLYYLPVTRTVLETYAELEQQEMEQQAGDLKDILNTVQHSFDTFVEKLLEGRRMDIEADIASVEMMLMNVI